MANVAIMVRQFGQGRICISADRISGYLTGHGEGHIPLWRKIIEWTSQKFPEEIPNIALVENADYSAYESIKDAEYLSLYQTTIEDLARDDISVYDLIYFTGLPNSVYSEVAQKLRTFVEDGGGIVVEDPNRAGENINVISAIDSVFCSSIQRPTYSFAYWTVSGLSHYIYDQDAKVSFMTTLDSSYINSEWSILMSDVATKITVATNPTTTTYHTIAQTGSEFGLSFVSSMKDGIVILDEAPQQSSSSSSLDSSSSSSFEDNHYWNFCDNIVAYWKMDENLSSPVVWDSSGDMKHMGLLKSGTSNINTSTRHVLGIVNGALSFDGVTHYIETMSNYSLNFVESGADVPFSVSMWIYPKSVTQNYFIRKVGVWSLYVFNGVVYGLMENGPSSFRIGISTTPVIGTNYWQNLTVTYDGTVDGFSVYVNGSYVTSGASDLGAYISMANTNSVAYMATYGSNFFFNGYMDNVLVVNKVLDPIEVQALYNMGRGTDQCQGIFKYTSSSSSSSSQSSLSSSSSIDSSSSSSFSSWSSLSSSSSISSVSSLSSASSQGVSTSSSSSSSIDSSSSSTSQSSESSSTSSSSHEEKLGPLCYPQPNVYYGGCPLYSYLYSVQGVRVGMTNPTRTIYSSPAPFALDFTYSISSTGLNTANLIFYSYLDGSPVAFASVINGGEAATLSCQPVNNSGVNIIIEVFTGQARGYTCSGFIYYQEPLP